MAFSAVRQTNAPFFVYSNYSRIHFVPIQLSHFSSSSFDINWRVDPFFLLPHFLRPPNLVMNRVIFGWMRFSVRQGLKKSFAKYLIQRLNANILQMKQLSLELLLCDLSVLPLWSNLKTLKADITKCRMYQQAYPFTSALLQWECANRART